MRSIKTVLLAVGLALAPAASAQDPAVVNSTASAAASEAAAPGPSAQTTAAATPAVATPAPPLVATDPEYGQPLPAGYQLQPQVTPNGERALWMHNSVLMPIIVGISLFVLALLAWVVIKYRRGANPVPSRTSHNTLIEIIWTLVPVLILVGIAVPSISLLAAQYKPAGKDALTIKAIGNQWYWTYEYPDNGGFEVTANMLKDQRDGVPLSAGERWRTDADGPRLLAVDNRIVIPVGRPIRLLTTSNDVIHSWAVPAFWTKMDAVPGRTNEVSFTVDRPGVYYGQCSELCGARHGFMPIAVEAVSAAQFAQWVASKGGTMPGAKPAPAANDTVTPATAASGVETPTPGVAAATAPAQAAQTNSGSK